MFQCAEIDDLPIRSGLFVSDLHLLSRRSDAQSLAGDISQSLKKCDCLILGGDIFDFKWSIQSWQESLDSAVKWVRQIVERAGTTQVIYLAGNHDCHPAFCQRLQELAQEYPSFQWHPHALRLGDCLFVHGDILDAGNSFEQLDAYRQKYHHTKSKRYHQHSAYDLAVAARLHNLVPRLRHPPAQTCSKLSAGLESLVPSEHWNIVRRVYFGHTHNPISGLPLAGKTFFNPGAALKHARFTPLVFELSGDLL